MTEQIRPFAEKDYEGIVAVHNAVVPDQPQSVRSTRHNDETRAAKIDFSRWVCEQDGRILAYAGLTQMEWMYHPRKFYFWVDVIPEARRRGIGGALYETVLAAAREREALSLRTSVIEVWEDGIRFLAGRSFVAGNVERKSSLDLRRFDPSRFAEDLRRVEEAGELTLLTWDELAEDPDRDRKYYELDTIVAPDMPSPEPLTTPAFEDYSAQVLGHPMFYPEGNLIAVDEDGGYVGVSNLWLRNVPRSIATGFTGVMREWRGRGVATALKVKVLGAAKAAGYEEAVTSNDSTNTGMLGINERLGFESRPAWIDYTLELAEETAGEER